LRDLAVVVISAMINNLSYNNKKQKQITFMRITTLLLPSFFTVAPQLEWLPSLPDHKQQQRT